MASGRRVSEADRGLCCLGVVAARGSAVDCSESTHASQTAAPPMYLFGGGVRRRWWPMARTAMAAPAAIVAGRSSAAVGRHVAAERPARALGRPGARSAFAKEDTANPRSRALRSSP